MKSLATSKSDVVGDNKVYCGRPLTLSSKARGYSLANLFTDSRIDAGIAIFNIIVWGGTTNQFESQLPMPTCSFM